MPRPPRLLSALSVLAALNALAFQHSGRPVDPVFRAAAARVERVAKVTVRLPAKLPELGAGPDRIYAVVGALSPSRYSIVLGFTPDCDGASACRIGTITGERDTSANGKLPGTATRLNGGVTGYFVDSECGANCSDATITWKQAQARYSAGVKAGTMKQVTALANSMIR